MEINLTNKFLKETCERVVEGGKFCHNNLLYVGESVIFDVYVDGYSKKIRVSAYSLIGPDKIVDQEFPDVVLKAAFVIGDELMLHDTQQNRVITVTVYGHKIVNFNFFPIYIDEQRIITYNYFYGVGVFDRDFQLISNYELDDVDDSCVKMIPTKVVEVDGQYWVFNGSWFQNIVTKESFKIEKVENVVVEEPSPLFGSDHSYFVMRKKRSYYFYSYEDIIRNKGKISDTHYSLIVHKQKGNLYNCFIVGKYLYFKGNNYDQNLSPIYRYNLVSPRTKSARSVVN